MTAIDICVAAAGGTPIDGGLPTKNSILEREVAAREDLAILVLPTIVVNGILVRGGTFTSGVLQTICAGFHESTEPPVCGCVGMSVDGINSCINNNGGSSSLPSGSIIMTPVSIVLIILVVAGIFIAGTIFTVRYIKKQTDLQVHSVLANYRPLDDFEDRKSGLLSA